MKTSRSLSARLAVWTGLFTLLFLCLGEGLCLFLDPDKAPSWMNALASSGRFPEIMMIMVAVVALGWGSVLWIILRRVYLNEPGKTVAAVRREGIEPEITAPEETKQRLHHDKKLFLHLLSILQTEGRLLDFLSEDLDQYEDGQIGAAARGVHERCQAALAKYITLQPLSDQKEGDPISVPAGFDSGSYRLSGNVTGEPPFSGRLAHKGWRAGRLNIPGFSFSGDPEIIAPIEVTVE